MCGRQHSDARAPRRLLGAESCAFVVPLLRGTSKRPLYVTAAGMEVSAAAQRVRGMAGRYRIPDLARMADRLARGKGWAEKGAARSLAQAVSVVR
jgi:deoxyribonuclease V